MTGRHRLLMATAQHSQVRTASTSVLCKPDQPLGCRRPSLPTLPPFVLLPLFVSDPLVEEFELPRVLPLDDARGESQHVETGRQASLVHKMFLRWLACPTRWTVNLDDWTLADEDGHTYSFHHVYLGGRSTVRVHTGTGRDTRTDLYQDRRNYVWDNHADTATLRNDHGRRFIRRSLLDPATAGTTTDPAGSGS
ncbi:lamin tail domain-containing protein [Streptomyces sp. NPDC002676]